MTTSMIKPMGCLLLRWRLVVALLGGIFAAMMMLLVAYSGESGAQTTGPVQAIAAGDQHGLAIVNDPVSGPGTVYGWGANWYGQVGDDTTHNNRFPPARVVDSEGKGYFTGVKAIEGGSQHSQALKSDGTVWAWGLDDDCQLGMGDVSGCGQRSLNLHWYTWRPQPVAFPSGKLLEAIAAGQHHSLALSADGTVWAWGNNHDGELGIGWDPDDLYKTPLNVLKPGGNGALFPVKAIAAGNNHSLALMDNGDVYAWGANGYGQLGDGSAADRYFSVQVLPGEQEGTVHLTHVTDVAAGTHHSLAIVSDGMTDNVFNDGTVYAWGGNNHGQLGINTSGGEEHTPVKVHGPGNDTVNGLTDVKAVAAGEFFSLALKTDGSVWAWGGNDHGQLGTNSTDEHPTPVQVVGPGGTGTLSGITDVAAGEFFSMALKNDGTVWAWGGNSYGQIDATLQDHKLPVQVKWSPWAGSPPEEGSGKPEVTQMVPAPGKTHVSMRTNVKATFSEKMDKSTLTKENFRLFEMSAEKRAIQIENVSVTPNPEGTKVTLDPYPGTGEQLSRDTEYVAVVTTGVEDLEGNAMATNEFWRFETGSQMR